MKGKQKRKGQFKKNKEQLHQYKSFISSSLDSPDGTVPSQNAMLVGSGEIEEDDSHGEIYGEEEVKKKPYKYKIWDLLTSNIGATIAGGVILAACGALIRHEILMSVLSEKVQFIEDRIETIEENYVGNDFLKLQLDLLMSNLKNDYTSSLHELEMKTIEIETRLSELENSLHTISTIEENELNVNNDNGTS